MADNYQEGAYGAYLADPEGMMSYAEKHFEWMAIKNYSESTIKTRRDYLTYFIDW